MFGSFIRAFAGATEIAQIRQGTVARWSRNLLSGSPPALISQPPYLKVVLGEAFSYDLAQHISGADDYRVISNAGLQAGLTISNAGAVSGPATAPEMDRYVVIRATNLVSGLYLDLSVRISVAQRPARDIPAPVVQQADASTFRVLLPAPPVNVPPIAGYDIRHAASLPLNSSSSHRFNAFNGITLAHADFGGQAAGSTRFFALRAAVNWGDGTNLYPLPPAGQSSNFSANVAQATLSAAAPGAPVFSVQPAITGTGKMGDLHTVSLGADDGTSRSATLAIAGGAPVPVANSATFTPAPAADPYTADLVVTATGPGGSTVANATIALTLKAPAGGVISNRNGTQNTPIATIDTAAGFTGAFMTYSLAPASQPLPAGLTLDAATGAITGTPTAAGAATIVVRATNSGGFGDLSFTLTISAAAATLSQLTSNGMTANLQTAVQGGYYVTGDPWALVGAVVTGFSTPSAADRHGAEWNPAAGIAGFGAARTNGWDNRMKYQGDTATDPVPYDAAKNIDPGKTGSAFTASAPGVIVKAQSTTATVATDGNSQRGTGAVQRYTPFTFVAAAPTAGQFRPPVRGAGLVAMNGWTLAAMQSRMGMFRSDIDLSAASTYPEHTAVNRTARLARLKQLQYSGIVTWWSHLDTHHSRDGLQGYGRNFTAVIGRALLDLHSTIPAAEKQEIAIALCQIGIDIYGAVADGAEWQDNGGWCQGRMACVLIAGLLFNDSFMLAAVRDPISLPVRAGYTPGKPVFAEQKTYHFVSAAPRSDGGAASWGIWVGSGGAANSVGRVKRVIIPAEMQGTPEWAINPYRAPGDNCAHPAQSYRFINLGSQLDVVAGLSMLTTAVDLTPLGAYFGAVDRGARIANAAWTGVYNEADPTRFGVNNAMMIRGECDQAKTAIYQSLPFARARWAGKPEMAQPPNLSITGTTVTVTCHGYEIANGEPITRRDLRWSQDGGANWTVIQGVPAVHNFVAAAANTAILVQVRLVSASGTGPWSTNLPNADAATNPSEPASVTGPRAAGTTGAASGVTGPLTLTALPVNGYVFDSADGATADAILRGTGTTGQQVQVRGESAGGNTAWVPTTVDALGNWTATITGAVNAGQWYTPAARIGTNDATRVTSATTFGYGHVVGLQGQSEIEHISSRLSQYNQVSYPAQLAPNLTVGTQNPSDAGNTITYNRITSHAVGSVNVGLAALANALHYILPGRKFGILDLAESGTSRKELMNNADDGSGARTWAPYQSMLDLWRAGGSEVGTVIECWYNSDAATIDTFPAEWSPLFMGQRSGGGAFAVGTVNPDSTRNPAATVDHILWDITTADPMTRGRGVYARGRTKLHVMTPMPFCDTDTATEQRNYNHDGAGALLNNRINQLDRPARDVMHSLADDSRWATFLRGVGFSAHLADFGGGIHPLTNDAFGVPQFAMQFLPAILKAAGVTIAEPTIIGTETAADGSTTDVIVDLPNGGTLTTTRIKAGVALPSPQPPHYQTVVGFEMRRAGNSEAQRRPVFKSAETSYPAAYRGAVTITDTGSGAAPNRRGKVRITWDVPAVNGDGIEYLRGEANGHLLEPRDVTARLFLDMLIEHVPAWFDASQPYPFYGVPVRPQPPLQLLTRAAGGDTTAPVISSPAGAKTGTTTASGSFSTNEGNGTGYRVTIPAAAASPSAAQVIAGQDAAGAAANAGSVAVTATGTVTLNATGLTAGNGYRHCFVHRDAAGNASAVAESTAFTTDTTGASPVGDPVQSWTFKISGTGNAGAGVAITNAITIPAGIANPLLVFTLATTDEANAVANTITATWAGASLTALDATGEATSRMALRTFLATGVTAGAADVVFTPAAALRAWELRVELFAGVDQATPVEGFDAGASTSTTTGPATVFPAAPSKAGCRAVASIAILTNVANVDMSGSVAEIWYDQTGTTAASDITVGMAAANDHALVAATCTYAFKDGAGAAVSVNGYARHHYYIRPA